MSDQSRLRDIAVKYAQCAEQKNLLSIALKYDPTLTIWLMRTLSQMEAKK